MNTKKPIVNYRFMIIFAIIVGVIGIALQFLPDFELLAFILTLAFLGGLVGGSNGYEEQDPQQLSRSYKTAFEWLLLIVLAAYALIELSRGLGIAEGVVVFLNGHWPGLIVSVMCIVMGIAGLQRRISEDSA
ncbi:MAG: hypothetical protein IMZ61_03995 [Planctomycetes bacterium]|nr:hypothetical protein [Planctomycetota bacterium]